VSHSYRIALLSFLFAIFLNSPATFSQQPAPAGTPVSVTVTVLGPKFATAPDIPQADVNVFSDKTHLNITRWEHAKTGAGDLQFAILIDENIRTSLIGSELSDLADFINALPPDASVGVFYGDNGSARAAAPFGTEHPKAAQSLRLTFGGAGASPSIYLSLADLAQNWPARPGTRREVLVLSSGNDVLNPGTPDPYFDSSLDAAQKAGITVHTVFVGSGRYGFSFRGNISQGKLLQLSSDTGGQPIGGVPSAPISLAPFLNNLRTVLSNQYVLTFTMEPTNKKNGELRPIQILLEDRKLKVSAPRQVFVWPN
jgi:hypothetical protein